ncbi:MULTISPECIES: PQQ-binding-like beta-propeller repeat protein [unclassified Streptomyces]|uniref:outer membrane protein assembly factor BamB family protein n=1 Tax=unclassified Streptomyces TaxID=2593676 RepID=UPI0035E04528
MPTSILPVPVDPPTTDELNAARKPGEARGWVAGDSADLPQRDVLTGPVWTVEDTVVQVLYRDVVARRVSDGAVVWRISLPGPVCGAPVGRAPDGKVVLAYRNPDTGGREKCDRIRMLDLKSGKEGWGERLITTNKLDVPVKTVNLSVSGAFFVLHQRLTASVHQISDGAKLFDVPTDNPWSSTLAVGDRRCHPTASAGGTKVLVISACPGADSSQFSQIMEIDPRARKVLWRSRVSDGQRIAKVYSVDPAVFTTTTSASSSFSNWRILALDRAGKLRSTIDPEKQGIPPCLGLSDLGGTSTQVCRGALATQDTLFMTSKTGLSAFSLADGKPRWKTDVGTDRQLRPLRAEGNTLLAYLGPSKQEAGRIVRVGPKTAMTTVLRHPALARETEYGMQGGDLALAGRRIVISPYWVNGDDRRHDTRLLSFGP